MYGCKYFQHSSLLSYYSSSFSISSDFILLNSPFYPFSLPSFLSSSSQFMFIFISHLEVHNFISACLSASVISPSSPLPFRPCMCLCLSVRLRVLCHLSACECLDPRLVVFHHFFASCVLSVFLTCMYSDKGIAIKNLLFTGCRNVIHTTSRHTLTLPRSLCSVTKLQQLYRGDQVSLVSSFSSAKKTKLRKAVIVKKALELVALELFLTEVEGAVTGSWR